MKLNLYLVKCNITRSNPVKAFFLDLFEGFASYARLLLEVFTRRNFGERYFSLSTALILAFILALVPPFILIGNAAMFGSDGWFVDLLLHYLTWYIFLGYFCHACFQRKKEIKRIDTEFDFERFSLSHGVIDERILNIKINRKKFDVRRIETLIEPGLFFIAGLVLTLIGQWVGILILFSSIIYSLSYMSIYKRGDNFILDMIDNAIANEQTVRVLVDGLEPKDTKGYSMYGRKPANPDTRQKMADDITGKDEPNYAV